MGLSTTYTKVETDFLIQQLEKKTASGYRGDLNKTEAAPTSVGFYGLLETGVYANLGGIDAQSGKLNFASFDGATWSLIVVDIPNIQTQLRALSDVNIDTPKNGDVPTWDGKKFTAFKIWEYGTNLYDKDSMTINDFGIDYLGIIAAHAGWKAAKIPVNESTQYCFKHSDGVYHEGLVGRMAYLDANGNVISTVNMAILTNAVGLGGKTFTTPTNCAFIYKNVIVIAGATRDYVETFQLQKGDTTTTYEASVKQLPISIIPNKVALKTDIPKVDEYVPKKTGKNKFNPALITEGKYIGFTNSGSDQIFTFIGTNANSSISGYQAVLPNTQYYLSGVKNIGGDEVGIFLDSNLNVLNGGICFTVNGVFTTPANCAFILFATRYNNATANYATIQLELGNSATIYEAYNIIGGYPTIPKYSNWLNKKILWMGTSIPAGNPSVTKPYPNVAGDLLGATMVNVALSGSLMRISKADGTQSTNGDYHYKNFARTKQEYQDLLSQFGVAGGSYATYPSYTQAQIDSFKLNSYEEKLLTHTDCDLFVFDFSWNDYMCDPSDMGAIPADITSRDRVHQWGAFNYCIDKLLTAKPNARFIIVGYWADYQLGKTNDIHKALADYWCVPYFNLAKSLGWSNVTNPGTGNPVWKTFCPDGIHPQSDTTGVAEYEIGRICAGLINLV